MTNLQIIGMLSELHQQGHSEPQLFNVALRHVEFNVDAVKEIQKAQALVKAAVSRSEKIFDCAA